MPYIYPEEVEHVRRLLLEEKTEEAFEILEGFEKTDNFTLRFHGGFLYFCLGNFEKVHEIAGRILEESKRVKNYFASFDSIVLKFYCFFMGENFDQHIKMVDLGEIFLKLAPKKPLIERRIRETDFLFMKGLNLMIEGKFDLALDLLEKSSASFEQNERYFNLSYASVFQSMSVCYLRKGELDEALELRKKGLANLLGLKGSKAIPGVLPLTINAMFLLGLGIIYFQKGEFNKAEEHLMKSLKLYRSIQLTSFVGKTLYFLIRISLRKKSINQARDYLKIFHKFNLERGEGTISFYYQLCNALILKSSPRLHDKTEAEKILRKLLYKVEQGDISPQFSDEIFVSIHLCEILLSELELTNEITVLGEIGPIITSLLKYAEIRRSYLILTEVKLLQAKLALINMDLDKARIFLTQAQEIAEEHGLQRLAQEISKEHDLVLDQLNTWELLKKGDAPISDRLKLASLDGVMERLKGAGAIEPSELIKEDPIMLTIMDKSGTSYFNHPFLEGWEHDDLLSSFLSAFNSFSDEMFSNPIDRIKIGENTILINPIEPFMACYVIKGQSYLAIQKLDRFTEAVKNNSEIWDALNKSVRTSEVLSLNRPLALGSAVKEIFSQ